MLEAARPFSRVESRPYDADLRGRVADVTDYAATLEPTLTNWPFGLQATARLAARVAGNASQAQLRELADADRRRRPLCAAVFLLDALADVAVEHGHDTVARDIRDQIVALFDGTDWASAEAWAGCEVYGAAMFDRVAALHSPEMVGRRLADALTAAPQRAPSMLLSCAQWVEHRDSQNPGQPVPGTRTYESRPAWLPIDELIATLSTDPAGSDVEPADSDALPDDLQVKRLKAELMAQ